jgi:lauroyl/myristoyl acyltransferase
VASAGGARGDPITYILNRGLAQLVPLQFGYWLSVPISDVFYLLWNSKREIARRNHAHILGRPQDDELVRHMAHRTFRHFGRYIVELLAVQGWSLDSMRDRIDVEGVENFEAAERLGKGVIFASAHMGAVEVASALALVRDFKITAVADRLPRMLMEWLVACRSKMGVEILPAEGAGMALVRRLRRREMVAMVVDLGADVADSLPVRFFGREARFPAGPARLARLSGAPIVFGWAARKPAGRYVAYVSEPILSHPSLDAGEDTRRITERIVAEFEAAVRRHPEQWYVFRDMWPADPSA